MRAAPSRGEPRDALAALGGASLRRARARGARSPRGALAAAMLAGLAACDGVLSGPVPGASQEAGTSPNASILPAPLASEVPESFDAGARPDAPSPPDATAVQASPAASAGALLDGGLPSPAVLRPDVAMSAESPLVKELPGVTLQAAWRWRDVPPPAKGAEVAIAGIKAARDATQLTWKIDLAEVGRMRVEFTSRALPLPMRTELRARADRLGHIALWPASTDYRVIAPGALRPLLGERRVDVTPLGVAGATPQGEGRRLGYGVHKVDLASGLGTLRLELAKVPEAGEGGALLCGALVEIVGLEPKTPACKAGEVPLAATYTWRGGGSIALEVSAITRRTDLAYNDMLVPPPGALFAAAGLPAVPEGIFLTREELAAFRSAALPLAPSSDPRAPGEGFLASNHSDALMYLLVDGVPVVAVPPDAERYVIGTARGRYVTQWRTFLGDRIGPAETVELPARLSYGVAPDAGAPDGG